MDIKWGTGDELICVTCSTVDLPLIMLHAMCENRRLVCINGKHESLVRCLRADQGSRTIMQMIIRSYHHVPNDSTISTMFISLRLLSAQLAPAIKPVSFYRIDTEQEK